jgi:hypothetical protein
MPSTLLAPPQALYGEWGTAEYNITAGQTFKPGDPVYLDTNGTLAIAATSGNDVGNIKIVGISQGDATQLLLEGLKCSVAIPTPSSRWLLTEANLDLGNTYPLRNQGGIWCLNVENNGTNDRMTAMSFHDEYLPGTTYGWVYSKFMHGTTFGEAT